MSLEPVGESLRDAVVTYTGTMTVKTIADLQTQTTRQLDADEVSAADAFRITNLLLSIALSKLSVTA